MARAELMTLPESNKICVPQENGPATSATPPIRLSVHGFQYQIFPNCQIVNEGPNGPASNGWSSSKSPKMKLTSRSGMVLCGSPNLNGAQGTGPLQHLKLPSSRIDHGCVHSWRCAVLVMPPPKRAHPKSHVKNRPKQGADWQRADQISPF